MYHTGRGKWMGSRAIAMMLGGIVLLVSTSVSQVQRPHHLDRERRVVVTGNARLDLLSSLGSLMVVDSLRGRMRDFNAEKKSPLLAGVLSMAIPGAGQYYAKSYWSAGGFILAEAGLWVFYASYTSKGNTQTDFFQNFADDHWSVVRYADWIQGNATKLNPEVAGFTGYLIPGTENRPPWERVDWGAINAIENAIAQRSGNGFTHQLPHRPEQQYFELIGKYPQFAAGWDDAGEMTPERIVNSDVSARFLEYSRMRGKANDFYNIATTGSVLIVVNHLLSALDAAWSAARFNNQLKLEAHLQPTVRSLDFVEFVPTARMTITF
jgi:hypothetical protein